MTEISTSIHAPELVGENLTWFNVSGPLTLERQRGKLVILDFWTFGCINCLHIIPILKRIEETFRDDVLVIGVHSPKFAAERNPDNVAAAIARYGILHPVVHDPDFQIWRAYGIRAWPTLIFISPDGHVVGQNSGEPDSDLLLTAIGDSLAQWRLTGALRPSDLSLTPISEPSRRLRFPGKLKPAAEDHGKSWVLADSGHHQIVLLDDDGREKSRYGAGNVGLRDGTAEEALFNNPQGLVATRDAIFIGDTGNHALRRIDRVTGVVKTLAGTGERGMVLAGPAVGFTTALASPWDVEIAGNSLFFANAGTHQLGAFDLVSGQVRCVAGSGAEGISDGFASGATLAQPSGLALSADGESLYFVDGETSSWRALILNGARHVLTLIGTGLFDFGHVNGTLSQARLQHPLGIASCGAHLAVADSYNDVVRVVNLATGIVEDLDEGSFVCTDRLCSTLAEPAGVAYDSATRLLVVDTNNHRVLEYDLGGKRYRSWVE